MITSVTFQNSTSKNYINHSLQTVHVYGEKTTFDLHDYLQDEVEFIKNVMAIVSALNKDLKNGKVLNILEGLGYKNLDCRVLKKKKRSYSLMGLTIHEEDI